MKKDSYTKKIKILQDKNAQLEQKNRLLYSDLKKARSSEQKLLKLFEFAPEAYYLNDLKGNFVDGNKAAAELLGYDKRELIGKNFLKIKILPKNQIAKAAANLSRNILGKSTGPDEFTLFRKDGTKILVEVSTKPVKIAGKRIVMGVARDITGPKRIEKELHEHREHLENLVKQRTFELRRVNSELKKQIAERIANENALKESEQKFRGYVETSADIVFQVSRQGVIEFVSPRVKEMYGYEAEELIGKSIALTTPELELSGAMNAIRKVFDGRPLKNFELLQMDKNGNTRTMEINAIPIKKEGKVIGLRGNLRDIAQRKEAEKVLRDSEERYRDLVEKANIGILIDDAEGNIRYHNRRLGEFFGYSGEEMGHLDLESLVHPADRSRVMNYHTKRTAGKKTKSLYEFRGQRKDGNELYLEVHVSTVREGGIITGTKSYMWDITSRKLAEKARKKSEQRYRELFNKMRDGSIILDMDGKIMNCNRAFLKISGYRSTDITEKYWGEFSLKESGEQENKIFFNEILQKKYSRIQEKQIVNKTGDIIPVELRAHLLDSNDDKEKRIWLIVRDITEQKRIESEVHMLAQTVRSVRECVSVTDLNDNILFVNDAFLKTYGYERDELIGENISLVRSNDFTEKINELTYQGGWEGELINIRKDGGEFPVFLSTSIINDEKGQPMAMVGVASDVSDRKKFESQFRQVQKMEAIGQLAGGIAHDFNNILTAINGYAELALMKMEPRNPLFKEITGILKAGKRAGGLVRQLLAFGRKQMIEPKVIEVNHLIIELDKMLRRLIGEDITVFTNLDDDLGNITADPGQIEQILVNIVVNARDAINQKTESASEKKISIETANVYLDRKYNLAHPGSREGMHVCISVSDTGTGMDPDTQSKVFEPFFTTKDKVKGTGLGLATVYGIVKQNNGYIDLYSEPGKGTTVKIYWPMESTKEITTYIADPVVDVQGGKETILFVEDNEEVRKFTISALKTLGYKVLSASHGREALSLVQQNTVTIDLVITDVIMPEMGGKELSEKIKQIAPGTSILFTSGYTDNHIVHSGILDKGVNFIHKPYSIERMATKIRQVLDNSSASI